MDETISFHVFPRSPFFWLIWVVLMLIVFPIYYVDPSYYRAMSREHEARKWRECGVGTACEEISFDATGGWRVYVRQPKYVADFVESPIQIRLTNVLTTTQSGVLAITVTPQGEKRDRFVQYRVGDSSQNFINVENVQGQGQAFYEFMVSVIGGQDTDLYVLSVTLDGKPIQNGYEFSQYPMTFDSIAMLWLWAEDYLLSPPAANIVIPIVLLLIISLSQVTYFFSRKAVDWALTLLSDIRLSLNSKNIVEFVLSLIRNVFDWMVSLLSGKKALNLLIVVRIVFGAILVMVLSYVLYRQWGIYEVHVVQVLRPLQAKSIYTFGKDIFFTLLWIGIFWGCLEQILSYRKNKDVQKVSLVPTENEAQKVSLVPPINEAQNEA